MGLRPLGSGGLRERCPLARKRRSAEKALLRSKVAVGGEEMRLCGAT